MRKGASIKIEKGTHIAEFQTIISFFKNIFLYLEYVVSKSKSKSKSGQPLMRGAIQNDYSYLGLCSCGWDYC